MLDCCLKFLLKCGVSVKLRAQTGLVSHIFRQVPHLKYILLIPTMDAARRYMIGNDVSGITYAYSPEGEQANHKGSFVHPLVPEWCEDMENR